MTRLAFTDVTSALVAEKTVFVTPRIRLRSIMPQIAVLLPLLMAIALIQVLPQVDLPETAFHEDSAPIVMKSRAVSAPAPTIVASVGQGATQSISVVAGDNSPVAAFLVKLSSEIFSSSVLRC
jgi:hypothetical protein